MPRFSRKTVIVTGSSNGIGQTVAVMFAKEGANVTITGRNSQRLLETKEQILKAGIEEDKVNMVVADLTTPQGQDDIINSTVAKFGGIDIFINNAGAAIPDPHGKTGADQSMDTFHKNIQINLQAVVEITKKVKPHLITSKGDMVNVSSTAAGPQAQPDFLYYSMAKAALDQYTRNIAIDLIQYGVRVNSVSPGLVVTGFTDAMGIPEEANKKFVKFFESRRECLPIGKAGRPEDIGNLILFLADRNLSEYIIGQTIVADGGTTLMMGVHAHNIKEIMGF